MLAPDSQKKNHILKLLIMNTLGASSWHFRGTSWLQNGYDWMNTSPYHPPHRSLHFSFPRLDDKPDMCHPLSGKESSTKHCFPFSPSGWTPGSLCGFKCLILGVSNTSISHSFAEARKKIQGMHFSLDKFAQRDVHNKKDVTICSGEAIELRKRALELPFGVLMLSP